MVHKYDEDRIRDVKEDIDTLLVFVSTLATVLRSIIRLRYNALGWSFFCCVDDFCGRDIYEIGTGFR